MNSTSKLQWITPRLAIGNIEQALAVGDLMRQGITAVLGLNAFPSLEHVEGLEWRRVELQDGPRNSPERLLHAVVLLEDLVAEHRVFVHCNEGLSRSVFVAAGYLARSSGYAFQEALALVQARIPDSIVDPGLLEAHDLFSLKHPE